MIQDKCYIVKQKPQNGKDLQYYKNEEDWIDKGVYLDPDVEGSCSIEFYNNLTKFLNTQEKDFSDKLEEEYIYSFNETKPYGIEVREKIQEKISGPIFYLKSDQFGFSAPSNKYEHPYDTYKRLAKAKDRDKKVKHWLYVTRSLGGSFLWPMESDGKGGYIENPLYNVKRGGTKSSAGTRYESNYYIEDRVDLTLYEIKQVMDYIGSDHTELQGNILWNCCLPETNMIKWLRHFRNFKTYVEFFKFDDFVNKNKKYIPYDITDKEKSVLDENKYKGKDRPRKIWTGKGEAECMTEENLKDMFDLLAEYIVNRSKKMIDRINKDNQSF